MPETLDQPFGMHLFMSLDQGFQSHKLDVVPQLCELFRLILCNFIGMKTQRTDNRVLILLRQFASPLRD
ncbi:hypothetical protein [Parazoarcus communis]|uniref:hypothetical protein n=1 Tax=Parazoarcus communis TaxID=41977 RepID=UPI00131EF5E4|nr:hypothetical protein [Parazoarcus communis]